MDWELYQRQRATLVFAGLAFLAVLLLAFQRSAPVQHLKAFFVSCTFPTQRLFSALTAGKADNPPVMPIPAPALPAPEERVEELAPSAAPETETHAEYSRSLRVLRDENRRLTDLLELKRQRRPRLVAARVVSRESQRWFQDLLVDKGEEDGVEIDNPVIAILANRETLIGRVIETGAHSSRVMLIHDTLSSVAATVLGMEQEDGVVEGSNSHDLYLKYLSRDSQVKIGDLVVTSGLGKMFPEGLAIGWVREIGLDERQLFLQARLSPAMASSPLRLVGILTKKDQ